MYKMETKMLNKKFGSSMIPESTSRIGFERKTERKKFQIAGPVEDKMNFAERAVRLQLRLASYQHLNWVSEKNIYHLAYAGFRYTGEGDRVECDSCLKRVYKWSKEDDPLETHFRIAPECPYIVELGYTLDHQIPKYRRYSHYKKRLESMAIVPEQYRNELPSFESLAKSGFFYQGTLDRMSCFHCGLVLRDWEKDTIPNEVHEQFQKNCLFITNLLEYSRNGQLVEIVVKDSSNNRQFNQTKARQNNTSSKSTAQLILKNIGESTNQLRAIEVTDNKMTTGSSPSFYSKAQKLESGNPQLSIPRQPTEIRHLRRIGKYAHLTKQEFERVEADMVDGAKPKFSPNFQSATVMSKAECVTSSAESNPVTTPIVEAVHEMGYSLELIYQAINERRDRGEGDFPDATALCIAVMDLAEKRKV